MEFGLTYAVSGRRPTTVADNFANTVDQIQLAEALGFAHAFISEHHFLPGGMVPSPLIALSYLAAKTSKIGLGSGILLMPLHDPVRVAEDAAVVDIISGGRLILGLGQGYRPEEFAGFHRRLEDRAGLMREGATLVRRFWTEEDVSFDGEFFQYEGLNVTPKPIQQPPPIWIGAKMPRAIRLAAEVADVWYADPITPLHLIEKRKKHWDDALDASGKSPGSLAYYREFWVGESDEEAWNVGGKGVVSEYMGYLAMNHLVDDEGEPIPSDRGDLVEDLVRGRSTVGSPATCIDDLKRIKDRLEPDHMVLKMKYYSLDNETIKRAMRLAAEKVLPNV